MRRRTPARRRSTLVLLVHCVVVALLAAPAAAAPADGPVPPRTVTTETGKYYVVGPPVDGQPEFLYAIAVRTLGDGTRYREIFDLNVGRPQPDGRQVVDATTVQPGWILVLPADAGGPDVRTGPLPDPDGPAGAAPVPDASTTDSGSWFTMGLRIMLLVLAVLLVVWARVTLLARRPRTGAATSTTTTTPQVTDEPRPAAPPQVTDEPQPAAPPQVTDEPQPAAPPQVTDEPRPPAPPLPDLDLAALVSAPPANPFASLTAELECAGQPAQVRLVGARPARWGSPYGWLPAGRRPPPAVAAVVLGERDGQRLWADLGHAPDVLTVVGDPTAARRHAMTLITQLGADTDVVVAADALGDDLPGIARWIPAAAELDAQPTTARLRVVVCAAGDAPALRDRLRQLTADGPRTVPVIVGPAPAARWSIRVGPATPGTASVGPATVDLGSGR